MLNQNKLRKKGDNMKVGIVGCGDVAKGVHMPALLRDKSVEIAAVCDIDQAEAKGAAKMLDIDGYYMNLSEMEKFVSGSREVKTYESVLNFKC